MKVPPLSIYSKASPLVLNINHKEITQKPRTPKSWSILTQLEKVVDQVLEIIDLASKEMYKSPQ